MIRRYQPVLSLVSQRDLALLEQVHVVDALSLAPMILECGPREGLLLDIGTGAGFPAIPLKVALPELEVVMVERQTKRVGFLQKVVGALGLQNVSIAEVDFPRGFAPVRARWVTARAVEKPDKVTYSILEYLPEGAIWFNQMGHPGELLGERFHVEPSTGIGSIRGRRFHVEPVQDAWSDANLRRGRLWRVWRAADPSHPE